MKRIFIYSLLFLLGVAAYAQTTAKKKLTPDNYDLWHQLCFINLSSNGSWTNFNVKYQDGTDTLFVRNTLNQSHYSFPKGNKGAFIFQDSYFLCQMPDQGLSMVNLSNGQRQLYKNVISYKVSETGKYIGILEKVEKSANLRIINLSNGEEHIVSDILEFNFRPHSSHITYVEQKKRGCNLMLMDLNTKSDDQLLAFSQNSIYKFLQWDESGKALVYFKGNKEGKFKADSFYYYAKGKEHILNTSVNGFDDYQVLPSNPRVRVFFSTDAGKVFFATQDLKEGRGKSPDDDLVQVWHHLDEYIYPGKSDVGDWGRLPLLSMWEPLKSQFKRIASREYPNAVITQDSKHALLFHPEGKGVQHNRFPDVDYTLMDLNSGKQKKILDMQQNESGLTQVSSTGRYISYYREKHWWIYDIKKEKHTNVTKNLKVDFYDKDSYTPLNSFGSPGWDMNDKYLIVYDQYDIWLITPDGSSAIKITDGRGKGKRYRLYDKHLTGQFAKLFEGYQATSYDLRSGLLMTVKGDDAQSGFARWEKGFGFRNLIYGPERNSALKKAESGNSYVYITERFDAPPKLVFMEQGSTPKIIYRSNPQQEFFSWGKAELVKYVTSKKDSLQGVLYYPANYQEGKKYPMVVNIYEKLSGNLHKYENPGYHNYVGYNKTNFSLNGYFVLEPDINYEIMSPGMSAVDAVESAVIKVLSIGDIDLKRVGLIGHSFGAYEVAFIASQSNLFSTVVAGAGIHNLISWYLTLNKDWQTPQAWRFEAHQMRMWAPYYEDMYAYLQNSTIHQVKGINIPILLWAGKEDGNVDWRQSLELYLALRRKGTMGTMLVYPKERHVIMDPKMKKDLTLRIEQWMDYHLKGGPPADWILKGDPKFHENRTY